MTEIISYNHSLQREGQPSLSSRYEGALKDLIVSHKEGINVFRGGPLDLREFGIENSWLTPVLVADKTGYTAFHAINLNADPNSPVEEVELNLASDLSLKLEDQNSPEAENFKASILNNDGRSRMIMRPSIAGNIAFPIVSTPVRMNDSQTIITRAQRAMGQLGIDNFRINGDPAKLDQEQFRPAYQIGDYIIGEVRKIVTPQGEIQVYGVQAPQHDPWQYYEILTPHKLEEYNRDEPMTVRVDSGCDIGQCYHDGGCDCRYQLMAALGRAQSQQGIVIHAPTQDGRGYGSAIKMATEGGKRGIDVGYNQGMQPLDTITAAQQLLGEQIDIRSYEGIATVLANLGFSRINLMTDSKVKLQALEKAGVRANRIPTGTVDCQEHNAHQHVKAKHKSQDYFGD